MSNIKCNLLNSFVKIIYIFLGAVVYNKDARMFLVQLEILISNRMKYTIKSMVRLHAVLCNLIFRKCQWRFDLSYKRIGKHML